MPDSTGNVYLFEALELRSEFDARINTLQQCLPEHYTDHARSVWGHGSSSETARPAPEVDPAALREQIKNLEFKRRKLNAAIQAANFLNSISLEGEDLSIAEALDLRKATRERIAELHRNVTTSAFVQVIHKEDRDIVEEPALSFVSSTAELNRARLTFRALNRALRQASHRVVVEFRDEQTPGDPKDGQKQH